MMGMRGEVDSVKEQGCALVDEDFLDEETIEGICSQKIGGGEVLFLQARANEQKALLEKVYHAHHSKKGRYGYLFCQGLRAPYLKEWIQEGKRVLDLGCRDGMLTQYYTKGNEVIGVDIDKQALKICEEKLGIQTHWIDLNHEWPTSCGKFDRIVACEIMEHLFFLDDFIEKVQKSLKEGGVFIGSVPNAFRLRNRWKFLWGKEYDSDPTHVRQFSYEKLFSYLKRSFSQVEIVPLGGKVLPFIPLGPYFPKKWAPLFAKDLLFRAT